MFVRKRILNLWDLYEKAAIKLFFGEVLIFYKFLCNFKNHYFQKSQNVNATFRSTQHNQQPTSKAMADRGKWPMRRGGDTGTGVCGNIDIYHVCMVNIDITAYPIITWYNVHKYCTMQTWYNMSRKSLYFPADSHNSFDSSRQRWWKSSKAVK